MALLAAIRPVARGAVFVATFSAVAIGSKLAASGTTGSINGVFGRVSTIALRSHIAILSAKSSDPPKKKSSNA